MLKILLVGDTGGHPDEGMKNTTTHLHRHLSARHEVEVMHPRAVVGPANLLRAVRFRPDVVHYIHGPTVRSFALTKLLSVLSRPGATVMSAPRPSLSRLSERLVPLLKPDLVLVQCARERARFARLGCAVAFLPGGVDLARFCPVSSEEKRDLRGRHGLVESRPLVLHVGQVTEDRGVALLGDVKQRLGAAADVLVVGASTIRPQEGIVRALKASGCLVRLGYVERIEEYYQMADCYVFPGLGRSAAIDVPLTVLEALACDLPVVSSRFGGLPELFAESGSGLSFASTVDEFVAETETLLARPEGSPGTRELVNAFDWTAIADRLSGYYAGFVSGRSLTSSD